MSSLAEQALSNLVRQFARPLDCLRELVQNGIDAGSPKIDVRVSWRDGVTVIEVADSGEGMDAAAVDGRLTHLFASDKQGDLTKIGRFGIGFTSVFALEPELVRVLTGRHGQHWEVLFHADRSFERRPLEEPVAGTRVLVYRRAPRAEAERVARESRWILRHWCEHSEALITFRVEIEDGPLPASEVLEAEDPFAAAVERPGEAISRPLDLEGADLSVRCSGDDMEAIVGLAREPGYGFYNAGLTLLKTRDPNCLGEWAGELERLQFKLKSDALEHTLTRDNVIQDENWARAMRGLSEGAGALFVHLVEHTKRVAAAGGALGIWHNYLAREWGTWGSSGLHREPMLRDHRGEPRSIHEALKAGRRLGAVLYDPGPGPLREALEEAGWWMLEEHPATRLLIATCQRGLGGRALDQRRADELFLVPRPIARGVLTASERALIEGCDRLLQASSRGKIRAGLGDLGPDEPALALEGSEDGRLFLRAGTRWRRLFGRRFLLINRRHLAWRSWVLQIDDQPTLACLGLAQAALWDEGVAGEKIYRRLMELAAAELTERGPR